MTSSFFEIRTPRDLLEKAKRDYSKMEAETSTDTVFNFFVTTYHVVDYVKALGTLPETTIEQFYDDSDFKMCQFLCNKGKHIKLRQLQSYEAKYQPAVTGEILNSFLLDSDVLGGPKSYVVIEGNKEVNTIDLGTRLLQKWEAFFAAHGIT